MSTMKAAAFVELRRIVLDEDPIPAAGAGRALLKVTTTTGRGTDFHILVDSRTGGVHQFLTGQTHRPIDNT
jgi:threonine dehydrogenase-like Zn-dependent dehydrogenase